MYLVVVLVVVLVVLVLIHDYVRKCSYRWKMLSQFPGDPPLPLIGNALQIGFDADGQLPVSKLNLLNEYELHLLLNDILILFKW